MSSVEHKCVSCEITEAMEPLEKCGVCGRHFCAAHAQRALGGRRLCSPECARNYYFHGDEDDDDTLRRTE